MKKIDLKAYDDAYTPGKELMLIMKINELVAKINDLEKKLDALQQASPRKR